jgi:hypothetical protein
LLGILLHNIATTIPTTQCQLDTGIRQHRELGGHRHGKHAIGRPVVDTCSRCIADLNHLGVVLTNTSVKYVLAGRIYFMWLIRRLRA